MHRTPTLNTRTLVAPTRDLPLARQRTRPRARPTTGTARLDAVLGALLVLVAVMVPALVAVSTGRVAPLAAAEWLTALVMLAVAVDAGGRRAAALAALAPATASLAWLGHAVAPEFAVLAAALVAGWLGWTTCRALCGRG